MTGIDSFTTSEQSTDRSLLARVRSGHDDGWHMLVQIYGPIVYGWIRRCGAQPADAADVMQETFLSASQAIARFDHDRSGATFRGWLWTIARNKLRDHQRIDQRSQAVGGSEARRHFSQLTTGVIDHVDPPSSLENDRNAVRVRALQWLRQTIEPRSWQIFWETAIEGRQPQDVADDMQVSRWAVYKTRARVLQRLREELKGIDFDEDEQC